MLNPNPPKLPPRDPTPSQPNTNKKADAKRVGGELSGLFALMKARNTPTPKPLPQRPVRKQTQRPVPKQSVTIITKTETPKNTRVNLVEMYKNSGVDIKTYLYNIVTPQTIISTIINLEVLLDTASAQDLKTIITYMLDRLENNKGGTEFAALKEIKEKAPILSGNAIHDCITKQVFGLAYGKTEAQQFINILKENRALPSTIKPVPFIDMDYWDALCEIKKDATELKLRDFSLTRIPFTLLGCKSLTTLTLYGNNLTSFLPGMDNLKKLEELRLSNNKLTSLPPVIYNFTTLETLDLSGNKLTGLSTEINKLTKLETLDFSRNKLTALPTGLRIQNLKTLNLSRNGLTSFPRVIYNFRTLKALNLSGNKLATLPPGIESLESLQTLNLSGNGLTAIPLGVDDLKNLQKLDLRDNEFSHEAKTKLRDRFQHLGNGFKI